MKLENSQIETSDIETKAILRDLITTSPGHSQRLVIFDLDSTLFCVAPRTQQILRDFASIKEHQIAYSHECQKLKDIQTTPSDWGIREALERADIHTNSNFLVSVRQYWRKHFFSNDYLHLDQPYEGAIQFVNAVAQAGNEILYLTARDHKKMWDGTVKSLAQHGFPLPSGKVKLQLKPDPALSDAEFKTRWIGDLSTRPINLFYFENEPVIIEEVRAHFVSVKIIFMDSVHSGRRPSPTGLPTLKMKFEW